MGFTSGGGQPSSDDYQKRVTAPFQTDSVQAFWTFSNFYHKISIDYSNKFTSARGEMAEIEKRALTLQKSIEEAVLQLYPTDKATALRMLTNYSKGIYLSALEAMARILEEK